METVHQRTTGPAGGPELEPLAVSPRQACLLLGCGITRLYQLLAAGELTSYRDGRARRITMASIRGRVARLAGVPGEPSPRRRRGRPRKVQASAAQ